MRFLLHAVFISALLNLLVASKGALTGGLTSSLVGCLLIVGTITQEVLLVAG